MDPIEGFYSMAFTGVAGSGYGLVVLCANALAGVDAAGAIYDGRYAADAAGIRFDITLKAPAGVWLVQTGKPLDRPMELPISVVLKNDFANGAAIPVQTIAGPINVAFRKLRGLPVQLSGKG